METLFRMVHDGTHYVTLLEKSLQDSALFLAEPTPLLHESKPGLIEESLVSSGRHFLVPTEVWQRAVDGDATSIAEVNSIIPGLIYRNTKIRDHLIRKTAVATSGVYGVEEAKYWLSTALAIFSPDTKRIKLQNEQCDIVLHLLSDVRMFREVFNHAKRISGSARRSRFNRIFPDLDNLEGKTKHGNQRKNWPLIICRLPDEEGDVFTPLKAALKIASDIIAYKPTTIYNSLLKRPNWVQERQEHVQIGLNRAKDLLGML